MTLKGIKSKCFSMKYTFKLIDQKLKLKVKFTEQTNSCNETVWDKWNGIKVWFFFIEDMHSL